jgi:molybdopterin converting factor small subunit
MRITVKLFATLRSGRFDTENREFSPGITIGEVIKELGIPEKEVTLIFVNGRHANTHDTLTDGDTIGLFPPVGGG